MKKLATLASAIVLSAAAGSSMAAVIDVTATATGGSTFNGGPAGTFVGGATGTFDDVTGVLTLNYLLTTEASSPIVTTAELEGVVTVNTFDLTGNNDLDKCTTLSGFNTCSFLGKDPNPYESVSLSVLENGDLFVTTFDQDDATGATQTIEWTVTPVPVPAAAWLFGSALLGLTGVARRKRA